jgi:hydrogenase nickel incorporation protein HypB
MAFKVIKESVFAANDEVADVIREDMTEKKILMINIISSPGAGKTTFLEKAGPILKEEGINFVVLTGDCYTTRDAERLDAVGVPVVQINTEGACHINAELVKKAASVTELEGLDLLIVENVGNLVCPAAFDLGEDFKVAFLSTAEGHDKPMKYPLLIQESPIAIINKIDLIPYTDFDMDFCEDSIIKLNPEIEIMKTSSKTGEGIENFTNWIKGKIKHKKENSE